jgi:hypothetical protein
MATARFAGKLPGLGSIVHDFTPSFNSFEAHPRACQVYYWVFKGVPILNYKINTEYSTLNDLAGHGQNPNHDSII